MLHTGLDDSVIQGYFVWASKAIHWDSSVIPWLYNQPVLQKFASVILGIPLALGLSAFHSGDHHLRIPAGVRQPESSIH